MEQLNIRTVEQWNNRALEH